MPDERVTFAVKYLAEHPTAMHQEVRQAIIAEFGPLAFWESTSITDRAYRAVFEDNTAGLPIFFSPDGNES